MPELAYVNGKFMPIHEAMVPIEDRGYQYADAVYEVVTSYGAQFFSLERHLDRLERSLGELSFPVVSREKVQNAMVELLRRSGFDRATLYLQISRGVAPRSHEFTGIKDVQIVMTIREAKGVPQELREKGVSAITVKDIRWGRRDIKTTMLLPNLLAKQKALEAGVFDAIFVTGEGIVREATSSNVFIVSDHTVITHPADHNILNGITRLEIMDCCKAHDIALEERMYTLQEMFGADEVFLSGTSLEVLPVVRIDDKPIGDGTVGPVAKRLSGLLLATP